ncbi:MAG TPA: HAMP domain-containing sensor histidine kinase [Rudaea sp.]
MPESAARTAWLLRRHRPRLRTRVALMFALLGLVVSACLALVAVHFSDSYVHRLMDEMLRVEGDYLRERYAFDGRTPRPRTKHFYTYLSGDPRNVPPEELKNLPAGVHELEDEHGERHVAVYEIAGEKLFVVLDVGLESARERRLARDLGALVVFGTVLSAWLGWFWAGRAIHPVRRLAREVERLQPSREGVAHLAPEFPDDEVGALAQAFDRYQEKLYDFVRRERAFTADASHELRTPLAVIRGAIEVLLDSGSCAPPIVTRLRRIQRGADELHDLLDALLVLARGEERDGNTADLTSVVDRVLGDRSDALRERRVTIAREGTARVAVAAPQKVLGVVVGNLLRATTQFADGGTLRVAISADTLTIAHEGEVGAALKGGTNVREAQDYSLGLGMIRRVCERWGWLLDETALENGRAFVLRF